MFVLCGRSSAKRFPAAELRPVHERTLDQFDLKVFHVLSCLFQAFSLAGSADLFCSALNCHYGMWPPLERQPFRLRDLRARHKRHKPVSLF